MHLFRGSGEGSRAHRHGAVGQFELPAGGDHKSSFLAVVVHGGQAGVHERPVRVAIERTI
eukprot:1185899-Prorocentrum_minimum.AAC.2